MEAFVNRFRPRVLQLQWAHFWTTIVGLFKLELDTKLTGNSSWDEIANVNFLYDVIVHVVLQIDSYINSATDPRGYVLERMFTKFSEITQCNGHHALQGHSRSLIFGTNRKLIYDFLLVLLNLVFCMMCSGQRCYLTGAMIVWEVFLCLCI